MFGNKINPQKIKLKNTKLLNKQGIAVIDHLPEVELKNQRKGSEIAKRCVALSALLHLYFEAPRELIKKYLADNDLLAHVTPEERRLLKVDFDDLAEQEQINLYWTIEAVWALVWVGGKHKELTCNSSVEDTLAKMLPNFQDEEPANDFIDTFTVRKQSEVFQELDKFYRAHWFARNNELSGKESKLADLSIIMERRKALEWVSDDSVPWDEISLDT